MECHDWHNWKRVATDIVATICASHEGENERGLTRFTDRAIPTCAFEVCGSLQFDSLRVDDSASPLAPNRETLR